MANWFNRLKPLRGRAGLYLMTGAALLIPVLEPQALGRRRAGREGSAPAAGAGRPGGSRQSADARPSAERQSVGPSRAGDQVRSTKVPIVAKEASPPFCVVSRRLGGQEARSACAAWKPFDGRRLSSARPPHYRLQKKGKGGTGRRPSLELARFPCRATFPIRRSGARPSPERSRGEFHPSIIPITLPVRPHMVTRRAIRMRGHRPDLRLFGKGAPSPNAEHLL